MLLCKVRQSSGLNTAPHSLTFTKDLFRQRAPLKCAPEEVFVQSSFVYVEVRGVEGWGGGGERESDLNLSVLLELHPQTKILYVVW